MSNEYKDWMWDMIQEVVLDRYLVDKITRVYPQPHEGTPHFVEGLKNNRPVKYFVYISDDGEWTVEHREF